MEFDKLKRSNESTDKQTTPGIDDIANSDIHVKYEQNDDFDVHMSVDSSSNTSLSNSDDIQEDVEEVEVETHRELTLHNDVINENNLDYHQNYGDDDDDVNIPTSTDVDYDADNDVPDIKDNFHSQYDQMINLNQHEYSTEESNPFVNDAFQGVIDNKLNWNEHKISIDTNLKSIARPRFKPIRQETLSGNNPFRKQSDIDEPNIICPPITSTTTTAHTTDTTTDLTVDELTRAAAGIKLIYPQNKLGHHHHHHHNKMKDSFDSMNSSCSFNEQDTQSSIELHNVEVLETIEGIGINPEGFDPLQTIYPDSDNENSSDSRELKGLHIKINQKANQKQTTNNSTVVSKSEENKTQITISPPPQLTKPINILDLDINDKNDEDDAVIMNKEDKKQDEDTHTEVITSLSTPPGWVDFFDDENDDNHSSKLTTTYKLEKDDIDKAFEIKCEAEYEDEDKGMVTTVYPELHRPETPDPELDKPFHPLINTQDTWRLWLRYPEKKTRVKQISKYTTDRYWREVGIRLVEEHGRKVINLYEIDEKTNEIFSQPYRSVRVEPYMQLSREKLQQYDKYGKLHVFKLNHVSYKELVGIRPEKFSIKNLQNLVSHKPKQNITLDHIPIYTEILKFGSLDQTKIRQLMPIIEDALMQIPSYKDTSLNYNRQEVCCYVIDEYEGKLNFNGVIVEQKARTRIYFTAFVNGGSHIILGLNDKWRYGREVVRRCDILPIMHDEWISIHKPEFHSCIQMDEYEKDHMLQFYPLDGCRFELLRFRVSLRENHELPMHIKVIYTIDGRRIAMRCDLLVPGYFSVNQRCGAIPCEKVEIHIPFPEEWIYHLRVEKHHKYGSVHSTLRKPGKIKGLERITQMAQSLLPPSMLEASIGVAKYEHLYKAIVWRIPRIPEKSEASFRPHLLTCNLILAQHDTVPEWESLVPYCQVEYTMPSSSVSGATVRSISVEHTGNVEKFVKYLTKYKYTVDIDYQLGSRKAPVIKSLLDDNDDDDAGNEYGRSTDQTQLNRQYDAISLDDNHLHHDDDVGDDAMKLKRLDNVEMTCDVNERQTSETAPTEFGDLLGLGTDFNVTSESISPQQTGSLNTDVIL
ncbi:unnamed protein product [Heterobilharzia americana]|nr:unnamed protein product [Heterobilharzia americana]